MAGARAVSSSRTGAGTRAMLASPGLLLFVLFFFVPLGFVVAEAVAGGTHGIRTLLASRPFWSGLLNSLVLGALAATISLGVGLAVALRLARMAERPRLAWQFLIALPLTFSGLIVAYGFILAFGRGVS